MESEFPNLIIAFFAGILSFVSPCVLPLVPAYIGYMSSRATRNIAIETGIKQKAESTTTVSMRFAMIMHGLAFVLGFTVVFVLLSIVATMTVSAISGSVSVFQEIIARVGGVIIIFFGLHFMGLMPRFFAYLKNHQTLLNNIFTSIFMSIVFAAFVLWGFVDFVIALPVIVAILLMFFLGGAFTKPGAFWLKLINTIEQTLYMDTRADMQANARGGLGGSFTMGVIFSAGWTPCIGPILGSILTFAANKGEVIPAATALTAYSLGLGIPFLITAALMEGAQSILRRLQKYMGAIEVISGLLLIFIGFSVATGSLQNLSQSLSGQTALATRIEDCGLGVVQGQLSLEQVSPCFGGSLTLVDFGNTVVPEFSAEDKTQSFLFEVSEATVVDVELAGLTEVHPAEAIIYDRNAKELARSTELMPIDENKYLILEGTTLPEAGQYMVSLSFTDKIEKAFSFRFRVRKSEAVQLSSVDNNATTVNVSNVNTISDLAATTGPVVGLEMGNRAPDFEVTTIDGEQTSLAALQGQVVLINFWGTWCPPCIREMPDLQTIYDDYSDKNFTILALATRGDTRESVLAFREQYNLSFPMAVDEGDKISNMYSIVSTPSTFIVNTEGVIIFENFGPVVESQLVEVLDGIFNA